MIFAISGSLFLGLGLIALWVTEFLHTQSILWLTWMTGSVGVLSLLSAAVMLKSVLARAIAPIFSAVVLFVSWAIGISMGSPAYQSWWLFWIAVVFLLIGIRGIRELEESALGSKN